ncbi:MAG: two-component regulator propeller domain-containing protein [Bacteroidales bacterium]
MTPATDSLLVQSLPEQSYDWRIYNVGNTGVPFDPTECILVDDYDNLWAGTLGGGLVKFDGTVWKVYKKENSWLPENSISALAKDQNGNIWIGTYGNGLSKFDGKNWRVYIPANSEMPDGAVVSIAFDRDNNIWFSTNEGDLVKVEGLSVADEPVWTFYHREDYDPLYYEAHPDNYITTLAIDSTGYLWMGTLQSGLISFDGDTFTEWTIPDFSYNHIKSVITDQNNHIWVSAITKEKRLARYDGEDWEIIEPDLSGADEPYFSYDKINSLAVDDNNDLWIGTDGGLIKYNGSEWSSLAHGRDTRFTDFTSNGDVWAGDGYTIFNITETDTILYDPNTTGLPFDDVLAVKIDRHGNSWIGTYYGLARMDGFRWKVYQMDNSDLPDSYIRDITMDDEGNIWIGTGRGVAMIPEISLPGQPWTIYNRDNSALPGNTISCLHYGNGNLWAGTGLGFARFDGSKWEAWTSENSTLPGYDIRSILTDRDSNIWLGTYNRGLIKLSFEPGYNEMFWEAYNTSNSELPDNCVPALEADSSGNIWIATGGGGLVRFDGEEFTIFDSENSEIPDNFVESLKLDGNGKLWIGMRYGNVATFDGTAWTVFKSDNSVLSGDAVYSIDTDKYGNIWIATDGGGVAVCNDDQVSIPRYRILSGHLFCDNGNTPLNKSLVELYKDAGKAYVDQLMLDGTNGYQFTGMESGLYTIKVIPDTVTFPETIPTWLGYQLTGADAKYVIMMYEDIVGEYITVIQRPPEGSGTGTVTGTLCFDETGKKKITTIKTSAAQGNPVSDCYVYLYDSLNTSLKAFDITSSEGAFTFSNLETGEYKFLADYRGTPMALTNPVVTVGSTNDSIHITAVADADKIAIEVEKVSNIESTLKGDLKVYPVPVREKLTVNLGDHNGIMDIEQISLIDLNGKVLYDHTIPVLNGSKTVVNMQKFPPGIYLLRVRGKDACRHIKVIKN